MTRAVRIGITGPIACGKSTVAGWLGQRRGVVVVDADHEARLILAPGTVEVEAVYARFGPTLRRPNGELDRPALGRIVFADPDALRHLEAIVHPAVRPRIVDAIAAADASGARAIVIEAIKLVEGGLADACDEVWLVTCDPAAQRDRLIARGSPDAEADARIAAQGDLAVRLADAATFVLDTTGSEDAVRFTADAALDRALGRQDADADQSDSLRT